MKNKFLIPFLSLFMILSLAHLSIGQVPQAFKYQKIVRDAEGNPMENKAISVRATIHDGAAIGPTIYQEMHTVLTNQFGLINLEIGDGKILQGTFPAINWGIGTKWMEIEADFGFEYVQMGISQLLSVPYALYSLNGKIWFREFICTNFFS